MPGGLCSCFQPGPIFFIFFSHVYRSVLEFRCICCPAPVNLNYSFFIFFIKSNYSINLKEICYLKKKTFEKLKVFMIYSGWVPR